MESTQSFKSLPLLAGKRGSDKKSNASYGCPTEALAYKMKVCVNVIFLKSASLLEYAELILL